MSCAEHPKGWTQATPDLECVDVWTPGQLTPLKCEAYDRLAASGEIRITGIAQDPAGRTIVRYRAAAPHEWELEALAKAVRDGIQEHMEGLK